MDLASQIEEVCSKHKGLTHSILDDDTTELHGWIRLDAEFKNIYLVRDFPIKILVDSSFPEKIPSVFLPIEEIPCGYEHVFASGALCLGAPGEMAYKLQANPSLLSFIDDIVISNLYCIEYFENYNSLPWGERSHEHDGLLEWYGDLFETTDTFRIEGILEAIIAKQYRGHAPCPCGSGIPGRSCHGGIIVEVINGTAWRTFAEDYISIKEKRLEELRQVTKKAHAGSLARSATNQRYK